MPTSCWIALQLELHLLAQLQVERAERLVEQQHARAVDERARERDALLLAARELARLAAAEPSSPTSSSISSTRPLHLPLVDALAAQPEGDVLEDGQVREERVALEDGVDVAPVRRQPDDVAVAEEDRALVGSSKPPIIRSVVVLPQPDGPSSAKKEPEGISSVRSSTATTSSKRLMTFSSRTSRSRHAELRERCGEDLGVAVDVGLGRRRAHQRHVVERREQDAAVERVQVQEALELGVARGRGLAAVARRLRREAVLGAGAEPGHVPRQAGSRDRRPATPSAKRSPERDHPRERLGGQHLAERRAHRRERERVAGERAADAADVLVVGVVLPRARAARPPR